MTQMTHTPLRPAHIQPRRSLLPLPLAHLPSQLHLSPLDRRPRPRRIKVLQPRPPQPHLPHHPAWRGDLCQLPAVAPLSCVLEGGGEEGRDGLDEVDEGEEGEEDRGCDAADACAAVEGAVRG